MRTEWAELRSCKWIDRAVDWELLAGGKSLAGGKNTAQLHMKPYGPVHTRCIGTVPVQGSAAEVTPQKNKIKRMQFFFFFSVQHGDHNALLQTELCDPF